MKIEKIQFYKEEIMTSLDKLKTENVSIFKEATKIYNHLDMIYQALQQQQVFNANQNKRLNDLTQNLDDLKKKND